MEDRNNLFYRVVRKFYKGQIYLYLCIIVLCGSMIGFTHGEERPLIIPVEEGKIDVQGHRGARGLKPENTIGGFIEALEQGVSTLELDVVVSGDQLVVVSHEPWMSHQICLDAEGRAISREEARSHKLYKMDYDRIAEYDCGSLGNRKFPAQEKIKSSKPLLTNVIESVEAHITANGLERVAYNIEIKSKEEWDGKLTPSPAEFAQLVYDVIMEAGVLDRSCIQSFDPRSLRAIRELNPELTTALLVNSMDGLQEQIDELGFTPDIYSPYHALVDEKLVKEVHELGMKIIPWTVNEKADMEKLVEKGVNGIITDYPNRAAFLLSGKED